MKLNSYLPVVKCTEAWHWWYPLEKCRSIHNIPSSQGFARQRIGESWNREHKVYYHWKLLKTDVENFECSWRSFQDLQTVDLIRFQWQMTKREDYDNLFCMWLSNKTHLEINFLIRYLHLYRLVKIRGRTLEYGIHFSNPFIKNLI